MYLFKEHHHGIQRYQGSSVHTSLYGETAVARESGRADRRHHRDRLKRARRFYWNRDLSKDEERRHSIVTRTPCNCSCTMCGNPRRWFGHVTMAELRDRERVKAELEDL